MQSVYGVGEKIKCVCVCVCGGEEAHRRNKSAKRFITS